MTAVSAPAIEDAELFAPFVTGLTAARLMVQRCATCGTLQLGRIRCDSCLGRSLAWVQTRDRGRIHAYAIMHRAYHPAFASRVPYSVGIVELADGPRLVAALDVDRARLRAGCAVRVAWNRPEAAVPLCFIEDNG